MKYENYIKKTALYGPLHKLNVERLYYKDEIGALLFSATKKANYLSHYKETVKKKRCFIIGNGPSLTVEDLDLLKEHDEDTFASNRIYCIYNKTEWRPNYYICQDDRVLYQIEEDLEYAISESEITFLPANRYPFRKEIVQNGRVSFFYLKTEYLNRNDVRFSCDVTKGVYEGMTVSYSMAQIAIYMGYKEIVFLGMDNNYSVKKTDSENHFNGMKAFDVSKFYPPQYEVMNNAFMKLLHYSDSNGISIINATRGGNLNMYKRVELEQIVRKA